MLEYVTFSIYSANIARFFDTEKLHHIELYPYVEKCEQWLYLNVKYVFDKAPHASALPYRNKYFDIIKEVE